VLVCFDATVLCGALRRPTGLNFRLLELAPDGVVIDGFTTEVAGMEFLRNALDGLAGVTFTIDAIEEFLDGFGALFDPDNVATSPIGRSLTSKTSLHNKPIGEVVYHLTGRTREELLEGLPTQLRVVSGEFDAHDVHLVTAASSAVPTSSVRPTADTCRKVDSPAGSTSSVQADLPATSGLLNPGLARSRGRGRLPVSALSGARRISSSDERMDARRRERHGHQPVLRDPN